MKRYHLLALCLALSLLVGLLLASGTAAQGPSTQLVMILDGSGSISTTDWGTIKEGLASAIEDPNCLPHDGSVELTVVQFGYYGPTYAQVEVSPIVIDSDATASTVATTVRNMTQGDDMTPMAHGIKLAADTVAGSPNFDPAIKQALNLVTDGEPNVCHPDFDCTTSQINTEQARDYAISTLSMTAGQDEFDAEGIDITDTNRDWLKDHIVFPQPGHIAPPFVAGWVRVVASATEFAQSLCEKIAVIVPTPTPTPTPAPVPVGGVIVPVSRLELLAPWLGLATLAALAALTVALLRRRRG